VSGERGRGWVFYPKSVALLSGLKITAEVGTFTNLLINSAGWLNNGIMSKSELSDYLTQRLSTSSDYTTKVLIQSDDTAFIGTSISEIRKLTSSFSQAAKAAGIKSSVEMGDKFLMRHLSNGRDTPVLARIWQNTISNEEPETDPLIFLVGLMMRTDGVLGHKTFDPFQTGTRQTISSIEKKLSKLTFESLLRVCLNANVIHRPAVEYLKMLVTATELMDGVDGGFQIKPDFALSIDRARKSALSALATREAQKLSLNEGLLPETSSVNSCLTRNRRRRPRNFKP